MEIVYYQWSRRKTGRNSPNKSVCVKICDYVVGVVAISVMGSLSHSYSLVLMVHIQFFFLKLTIYEQLINEGEILLCLWLYQCMDIQQWLNISHVVNFKLL